MKVEILNREGKALLVSESGERLKVPLLEFWEICRIGHQMDVRDEIENYLEDGGEFEGVDAETVKGNAAFMDEVLEKVISDRYGNENGDQIYGAICYCVKYGKNKDSLVNGGNGKKIEDMEEEDFKDPERRKEFGNLIRESRTLRFERSALNYSPEGVNQKSADEIKLRLGDVVHSMDLLRVKEWLAQQPYDLDVESPRYREAMELIEEVCGWFFPELAGMAFDGEDIDLIFREPHDSGLYVWAYYNPDANAGGQIVEHSFGAADSLLIAAATDPAGFVDANHTYLSDVNRKEFFMTIFDMLKMKENGFYLGSDLKEVCRNIFAEHCNKSGYVVSDPVPQHVWHGDVDVPYGFPGLNSVSEFDSMELAAPEMLRRLLLNETGFRNVSVEQIGYYNNGIGYSFSFETNLPANRAGSLVQKALDGLKFEACSDVQPTRVEELIDDAQERAVEPKAKAKDREMEI